MSHYSDKKAAEMRNRGINTIVVCETCDERQWSMDATFEVTDENWYCDDCYTRPERQTMDTSELED